MSNTVWKH